MDVVKNLSEAFESTALIVQFTQFHPLVEVYPLGYSYLSLRFFVQVKTNVHLYKCFLEVFYNL